MSCHCSTFFFRIRRRGGSESEQSGSKSSPSKGPAEDQQGSQYDAADFLYGWVLNPSTDSRKWNALDKEATQSPTLRSFPLVGLYSAGSDQMSV